MNAKNNNGLTPARRYRSAKMLKFFIDNGANPNVKDKYGNTPLHNTKNPEIAKMLIDGGTDVNAKSIDHNSTTFLFDYPLT